ncbi:MULTISPECIES: ANTAR domain-containing response regulator [unclassified Streptomyces]|uniref:ANTAR domain-containing response regulator n=1 Tax=unclassified Streptomyces TaxID=2593676 RepID=UPI002E1DD022|nr:ANTAR domain-containing protein [Streptomyces sp. NBC_01023]
MDREQQWIRSAFRLAAVAADEARAPSLLRQLGHECAELLQLSGAGVMPAEAAAAHSGEPGPECLRGDRALTNIDLREQGARWPGFTGRALADGHTLATLLPLHDSAGRPCAVLQLFSQERELSDAQIESAQRLGELAMVLQAQSEELRGHRETVGQLSRALDSRIVIEQAKGMLAEQLHTGTGEAFGVLRGHARSHRLKLADVARAVVDRELRLDASPSG